MRVQDADIIKIIIGLLLEMNLALILKLWGYHLKCCFTLRTSEVWQDNVPMWEKKFCYLVGRMPWKKVLGTRNFMTGHSNVLSWDDSAGKEAFFTAKKRFWEEFNGFSCETQLPDPDMYIDQIDWNPYIDPDLIKEADREYFNPDDKYYLPSTSRSNKNGGWPDDVDDPWERDNVQSSTEKNKTSDWSPWDNSANDASKSNKDVDPWESLIIHENGAIKDKATGQKLWDSSVNHANKTNPGNDPWENHSRQGKKAVWGNTWGGEWNKSWGARPNNYTEMSNNRNADGRSWRKEGSGWKDCGASSRSWNHPKGEVANTSYWSEKNRPQEYGSQQGSRIPNHRGGHWGQKPRDKYNWGPKDNINIHRNQGQLNAGCRKRGSPDHYVANQEGPRCNNKRVSFGPFGGQWS